jgi:hypothetical protein
MLKTDAVYFLAALARRVQVAVAYGPPVFKPGSGVVASSRRAAPASFDSISRIEQDFSSKTLASAVAVIQPAMPPPTITIDFIAR